MAVTEKLASVGGFNGLRTDCTPATCDPEHSPDLADMMFAPGSMETRFPFRVSKALPEPIVYRKEFTCKNGAVKVLALGVSGTLYEISGETVVLDRVAPGSHCNSVTAYGREYMAFFDTNGGSDAPRFYDGKDVQRVSKSGPGAAPVVVNYSIPASQLVTGSGGAAIAVASITPSDQQTVQIGGGYDYDSPYPGYGGGYNPPTYQTYYTTLTIVTTPVNTFTPGQVVSLAGNTHWGIGAVSVAAVIDAHTFKVFYQTQDGTVGTGGTATPSAPFLARLNNEVTAATATPHGLRRGYLAKVSGLADQAVGGGIASVTIDNTANPGLAKVTMNSAHGLAPGEYVTLSGVGNVEVGGGIVNIILSGEQSTLTTTNPHGLQVDASVLVQTGTGPYLSFVVTSVPSPTQITYAETVTSPPVTKTGGHLILIWPGNENEPQQFAVDSVDSPMSFFIPLSYSNGTWTGGQVTFPWNGVFYVTSVPSATTFTYRQIGPNQILQAGTGMITPQGQIAAGDHYVTQSFVYDTGYITAPSPPFKFTASGNQFALAQQLLIGPEHVIGRLLSFTGTSGSAYAFLYVPAQVNGLQVASSTLVNDNTSTSAIIDFSDTTLLSASATRADVAGQNLFQQTALNLPRGVKWYKDRLYWLGEKNTAMGLLNMDFAGGPTGSAPPGWTQNSPGTVTQPGSVPVYEVTGPNTGELVQAAANTALGAPILEANEPFLFRFWTQGAQGGQVVATLSSQLTAFTSTASYGLSTIAQLGYYTAAFDQPLPSSVPGDLVLTVKITGLPAGATAHTTDWQLIYASNPERNPLARTSYLGNPEAYDFVTGNIGPADDPGALLGLSILQESLHFHTTTRIYYAQAVSNSEPSSWDVDQISDKCGIFNASALTEGKGWVMWAGPNGFFRYTGGVPDKLSAIITPNWRTVTNVSRVYDDADQERVYIGTVDTLGNRSMLTYDYHELTLGGPGKWCPWRRPLAWVGSSATGTAFVMGSKIYRLDTVPGTADDDFGDIGGYAVLAPFVPSMIRKDYAYFGLRITGSGKFSPMVYNGTYGLPKKTLGEVDLSKLLDDIAEWDLQLSGRLLWMKLGQAGARFRLEDATVIYRTDGNAPLAGVR